MACYGILEIVVFTARCTLVQSAVLGSHVVCLSVPNIRGLLQGEHPEILAQSDPPPVDLSVGDIRSPIAAERLQIAQRSQLTMESLWNHHRSFEWCHRRPPTTSPSSKMGGSICPKDTRMAISPQPQRVIRYTSCLVLGHLFQGRRSGWTVPHPYSFQNLRVFPWRRPVMLGYAKSEHNKLTNREVLFSKNSNVITIHQRYRQTDGRTDAMRSQDRALHCSASRGKNSLCLIWASVQCSKPRC